MSHIKDITPYNHKNQKHGYHKRHYNNRDLMYEGNFINDNTYGIWLFYLGINNSLSDKILHI